MNDKNTNNKSADFFVKIVQDFEASGELDIERAKINIAERIFQVMERELVSKAELARRLNKSRPYVTQILQGGANFTIESLVRIAIALNCELDLKIEPKITHKWERIEKPLEKSLATVVSIAEWREINSRTSNIEASACASVEPALAMAA